jgi:hypothetical protein
VTNPITVNSTPVPDQITSAVRTLIQLFGMWAVGRGYLVDSDVWLISGLAAIAVPFLYNQLRIRRQNAKMQVLAEAAPDSVAQVK